MRKLFLVAVALMIALGAGLLILSRTADQALPDTTTPARHEDEPRAATEMALHAVALSSDAVAEGAAMRAASISRTAIAPAAANQALRLVDPWLLRVVERDSGKSIAGAVLRSDAYRYTELTPEQRLLHDVNASRGDGELNVQRFGKRYVSDARGEVVVPRQRAGMRVLVTGDFYAEQYVNDSEPSPVTIRAERDFTLRVQAVDARGSPVPDLPFAIEVLDEDMTCMPTCRFDPTSDPSIRATRHFQTMLNHYGPDARFVLLTGHRLFPEARFELQKPAPGQATVRVPLPPNGRVVVTGKTDSRGRTMSVWLGAVTAGGGADGYEIPMDPKSGVAVFRAVGLGLRLRAASGDRCVPDFSGPVSDGQEVVVTLR